MTRIERKVIVYKDYTSQDPFVILEHSVTHCAFLEMYFGAQCNTLRLFGND